MISSTRSLFVGIVNLNVWHAKLQKHAWSNLVKAWKLFQLCACEREDFWCVSNWLFLRLKSCHNFIFIVKKWWDHEFSFLYVPIQIEIYSNICNSASNHKIIISVWNMNTCWILILLSSQLVYYLNWMISYVVFFICQWHRHNFLSPCKLLRTTSSFQWDWATGTLKTPSSLYIIMIVRLSYLSFC